MKTRTTLKKYDLVVLYRDYLTHLSAKHAGSKAGITTGTAYKAIKTLQGLLAGEKVNRKQMMNEFILAAEELKRPIEEIVVETHPVPVDVPIIPETPETKIERLLEELKMALVDYAYEKAVTDVARKSNIVGFLNSRFQR